MSTRPRGLNRAGVALMNIDLSGRTAFITGGSKGIGLAVARQMAVSGAEIVIVARGSETLDAAAVQIGGLTRRRILALQGDVSVAPRSTPSNPRPLRRSAGSTSW